MRSAGSSLVARVQEHRSRMGVGAHALVLLAVLVVLFALSSLTAVQPQHHASLRTTHLFLAASDADRAHQPGTPQLSMSARHAAAAAAVAAAAAAAAAADPRQHESNSCHVEHGAEYSGDDVIQWGEGHLKDSAEECCAACRAAASRGCNVWVWCGAAHGCGGRSHRECWLKRQRSMRLARISGARGTAFTSGALYDDAARAAALEAEAARLAALRADAELPLVWLDVAIRGKRIGRVHFVLFSRDAPRAAENFRQLCTGEAGMVPAGRPGAGEPYSLRGRAFYRIIHGFIDQAGAGTDSVFGGQFKDDPGGLALKHDRKGLLSMANTGPDTNDSHFSIMVEAAPHLDGHYTIFGEALDGADVIDAINALALGKPGNTATSDAGAVITDVGQIRRGRVLGAQQLVGA